MKRKQPRRDWEDAREKVTGECACRLHRLGGCAGKLEAAHVIGREHDGPWAAPEWQRSAPFDLYVNPDSIVPLCTVHHDRYDGRAQPRIDILHVLSLDEQLQAVRDAGSVESMRRRTAPSAYQRSAA